MYSKIRMTSEDRFLRFIVQEEKIEQCIKSKSPNDSSIRLYEDTQSKSSNRVNNCSKCTNRCGSGSFQLDYSNDFHINASKTATSSSSCSEQNTCGSSQNYYFEDFHTDSSAATSSSGVSGSHCGHLEQLKTKKEELSKEKKENDCQTKGRKMLPKKKKQQKTSFGTDSIKNALKANNVACRVLSARLHKVKELKNEVFALKNKLEASNMENQLLKRLQFRHLKAIGKYENAEANLPELMAKHNSEVRTLRALLRKSQEQERHASRKLREVEAQLLKSKDALQVLQKLSEDQNLAEREELTHRLANLTERMESSHKKIQGLEKQLLLNNTSFSHQLAAQKKKTVEAQMINTNLQTEIKSLNQKIKEKERELGIRNIYTNRMLKGQQDKSDPESPLTDINVSKSVQVGKSFKLEATSPLQKRETNNSAIVLREEKTIKDTYLNEKLCDMKEETELKTEVQQTEKLPKQEILNKTCKEMLRKEICSREETNFKYDYLERQKKKREVQGIKVDLLNEELEKLMTVESFQSPCDNLEEAAVDKQENEASKRSRKQSAEDAAHGKLATLAQRHTTPLKLKKQYVFTEAIENLHQGLPSSGPISNTNTFCNSRQGNKHQSEMVVLKAGKSASAYDPSFGKVSKTRQKDTSPIHSEDHLSTEITERKNTLMEELFGPSCIFKDSHPSTNLKDLSKEKKTLQSERLYDEISYISDGLQCGDSKQTLIKGFHTVAYSKDHK